MTITAWRIVQARHARHAFTGEGARRYGGRWNHRGIPMVYASGSIALAALELLAHLDDTHPLSRYVCIPATFDTTLVHRLAKDRIPRDWQKFPAPDTTKELGTAWVRGLRSAVLAVPSVMVPEEANYLLNPAHPDFGNVRIGKPAPFLFDRRLKTSR